MSVSDHNLESLEDVERVAAIATAAALLLLGASRRSAPGVLVALAAAPFAYRGFTGRWPGFMEPLVGGGDDTRDALGGSRGVHVHEAIRLKKPLPKVYAFWRHLENLPRFMGHLDSVTEQADGRSHWVAKGPADLRVEWDAEIINEVENQVIGWRSLPGADVVTAGSVTFAAARAGHSTQVTVNLQYAPPAGKVGAFLAGLFGREPSHTIREDLRRLKQLLEAGEIPQSGSEAVHGGTR